MPSRVFSSLADFGFNPADVQELQRRLVYPCVVFVSGPAGGGKSPCATMIGWFLFQGVNRPFRIDGAQMTPEQVRELAVQRNHGILFHDVTTQADLAKVAYCADCRMVAIANAVVGEAKAGAAHQALMRFNPAFAMRKDLIIIGVEPNLEAPEERYHIDCRFPVLSAA